jgi:aspartate carbamoyltransferase catalytic subunit
MEDDIRSELSAAGIAWAETEDMEAVLPELDAIYITRIQDEHDQEGESAQIDLSRFKFLPRHLSQFKQTGVIMHPLPRRDEIHPEVDEDFRAKYWRQERNGMWMRVAILTQIFEVDHMLLHAGLGE